jgi:hypothetical protein
VQEAVTVDHSAAFNEELDRIAAEKEQVKLAKNKRSTLAM